MSAEVQQVQEQETKATDKEFNFRQLETKFRQEIERERAEKQRLSQELEETKRFQNQKNQEEIDDDSEPYIDHKRLTKTLSSFEKKLEEKIEAKAEQKARDLLDKKEKDTWMHQNPDYYEMLQKYADKLAEKAPMLAQTILKMPDSFERTQLVYENIKALGLDKPEIKQPSIQEKIDANRRTPYYRPTDISPAPYKSEGDFSPAGQ